MALFCNSFITAYHFGFKFFYFCNNFCHLLMDLLHAHTQCCLGQDLFTNMYHHDLDLQMTLTFNIVL